VLVLVVCTFAEGAAMNTPIHAHHFAERAHQYYTVARFAMYAQTMPVVGTLFHHAVEMALKSGLAKKRPLTELKDMGHDLKKLWKAFKADFPNSKLDQHNGTVSTLNKYEEIRYPNFKHSIGMVSSWSDSPGAVIAFGGLKTPKQYPIVVDEIDALMADVIEASSWNPRFFASTNPAALTALRRHNKHWPFLIRGSKRRKRKP
jgi:hypothetical protein